MSCRGGGASGAFPVWGCGWKHHVGRALPCGLGKNQTKTCLLVETPRLEPHRNSREKCQDGFPVFCTRLVRSGTWIGAEKDKTMGRRILYRNISKLNSGRFVTVRFIYLVPTWARENRKVFRTPRVTRSVRLHVQTAVLSFKLWSALSNTSPCSNCCLFA